MNNTLSFNVAELDRRLANIIRVGRIAEVDYPEARARVEMGETRTYWLPWLTARASFDRSWWAPEIGEQVLVLSPSGDLAQGLIIMAVYQKAHPKPAESPDIMRTVFKDQFVIEHDRARKHTTINAWDSQGTVEIRAKNIILKTGEGGFFHLDHHGRATRITHMGGASFQSESWQAGSVTVGLPDHGYSPKEVQI